MTHEIAAVKPSIAEKILYRTPFLRQYRTRGSGIRKDMRVETQKLRSKNKIEPVIEIDDVPRLGGGFCRQRIVDLFLWLDAFFPIRKDETVEKSKDVGVCG